MKTKIFLLLFIPSLILSCYKNLGHRDTDLEFVDLGLSVKWATCNVGASKPEEYGDYFAWGETRTKENYDDENYFVSYKDIYFSSKKSTLDSEDDAAYVLWGEDWRMPTKEEFQELVDLCKWAWTTLNDTCGYQVIGPNGNSIFLPTSGMMIDTRLLYSDKNAYYWSSSISSNKTASTTKLASQLFLSQDRIAVVDLVLSVGRSIRPVTTSETSVTVRDIKIKQKKLELTIGAVHQLSAEVIPSNATKKIISWSSDNTDIASVDRNGKITAVSTGRCTITVTCGAFRDKCKVVVLKPEVYLGHDYIDLGLSVMWATTNVGADQPEDYGDYFAWGETKPKSEYTMDNCFDSDLKIYNNLNGGKTILTPEYDAAHVNWGGNWRMPTIDEIIELKEKCTFTETTQNNVPGYLVRSKTNANSIFLPAAGYHLDNNINYEGYWGHVGCFYLSSSLNPEYSRTALCLVSNSAPESLYRFLGQSVRPVFPSSGRNQTRQIEALPQHKNVTNLFEWSDGNVIARNEYIIYDTQPSPDRWISIEQSAKLLQTSSVSSINNQYKCYVKIFGSKGSDEGGYYYRHFELRNQSNNSLIYRQCGRYGLSTTSWLSRISPDNNYFRKINLDNNSYALIFAGDILDMDGILGEMIIVVVSKNVATLVYDGPATAITPTDFDSDSFSMDFVTDGTYLMDPETGLLDITPAKLTGRTKYRIYKDGNVLKIARWE